MNTSRRRRTRGEFDGCFVERALQTAASRVSNPARLGDVEIRECGSEVLVHDVAHEKVHVLNRTAGFVLLLCDGTRSRQEIARSLSAATGAPLPAVRRDVDSIVDEFNRLELLGT